MFLNGKKVESKASTFFDVHNPATGDLPEVSRAGGGGENVLLWVLGHNIWGVNGLKAGLLQRMFVYIC